MSMWTENNPLRHMISCDMFVSKSDPNHHEVEDPFDDLIEDAVPCKIMHVILKHDLEKFSQAGGYSFTSIEDLVMAYMCTRPEPWTVHNLGYSTGQGKMYRYVCDQCTYEMEYPY
jgi:hypothetical protein